MLLKYGSVVLVALILSPAIIRLIDFVDNHFDKIDEKYRLNRDEEDWL